MRELFSKSSFGLASLGGGSAPSLMDISTPTLQFVALLLGVIIAFVTAILKIQELWQKVVKRGR